MEVDMMANMEVDMVADMEENMVADMEVDMVLLPSQPDDLQLSFGSL